MNNKLKKDDSSLLEAYTGRNGRVYEIDIIDVLDNDIDVPIIYNLLGASYSFVDMNLEAIDAYQNALRLDKNNEEILRNLGKSYIDIGDNDKAYEYFKKAISIKPNNADAIFGIGLLDLKNKKFKESIEQFNLALKYNKNFFQAYYNQAIAQNNLGNLSEAKKVIQKQ